MCDSLRPTRVNISNIAGISIIVMYISIVVHPLSHGGSYLCRGIISIHIHTSLLPHSCLRGGIIPQIYPHNSIIKEPANFPILPLH